MTKKELQRDLLFLREIEARLTRNDPEEIKYAIKMVDDWIQELEGREKND